MAGTQPTRGGATLLMLPRTKPSCVYCWSSCAACDGMMAPGGISVREKVQAFPWSELVVMWCQDQQVWGLHGARQGQV